MHLESIASDCLPCIGLKSHVCWASRKERITAWETRRVEGALVNKFVCCFLKKLAAVHGTSMQNTDPPWKRKRNDTLTVILCCLCFLEDQEWNDLNGLNQNDWEWK